MVIFVCAIARTRNAGLAATKDGQPTTLLHHRQLCLACHEPSIDIVPSLATVRLSKHMVAVTSRFLWLTCG